MDDQKIRALWLKASRLYLKGGLARRIALLISDDLEREGVTSEDIDRLFPLTPIQIYLRDEFVDASID